MIDFIRDLFSAFKHTSLERVKSPFLGAFVFSWIGFNWPMLSVLFFSKKDIETRLEFINNNYDIGNYLLGPICTTALISILLPQINKIVTKIQDRPNTETVELNLASKIKIAELQQNIAEIEARKKLAEKKEEKYIDESIYRIKSDYEKSLSDLSELKSSIEKLRESNTELQGYLAKTEVKLSSEQESKNALQSHLATEKENNKALNVKSSKIHEENKTLKNQIIKMKSDEEDLNSTISELLFKKSELLKELQSIEKRHREIFSLNEVNGKWHFRINNQAKQDLRFINSILNNKRQKIDYNSNIIIANSDLEEHKIQPINYTHRIKNHDKNSN